MSIGIARFIFLVISLLLSFIAGDYRPRLFVNYNLIFIVD